MQLYYLKKLLGIQGYSIANLKVEERRGKEAVILELKRLKRTYECGICHKRFKGYHSRWWIEAQHLMLWQYPTFLRIQRYRVECPEHGVTLESLGFITDGARVTHLLASLIYELCKVMTVQAVAIFQCLHRNTVKNIDKMMLEAIQANRSLDGITVLGADEIAVGKGHNYWTMVSALEGPRGPEMLQVVEGRREKDLNRFWKWFGKENTLTVTHVVIDMWKPFIRSFKAHCRGVKIIYDKFHIIRHLLQALNKVRKAELRRAGEKFKGLLAGKKFILLSRQAHIRGKARVALKELLTVNHRLFKAHLLKESFGHLWSYSSKTWAKKFFRGWVEQLKWSHLKPYKRFAKMMDKHLDGILSFCDKKVSLGYIEACNLKAKNVIRRAYGYRDKEYMKLKIIQTNTLWMSKFTPWLTYHKILT
jgi:transposase